MAQRGGKAMKAGWGSADITPKKTVQLYGQYYQREATLVRDPLSVTALALEGEGAPGSPGQAILVSCDQVQVEAGLVKSARERLKELIPDFDPLCLVISATHTHTAPAAYHSTRWKYAPGSLPFEEFRVILLEAIVGSAVKAWKGRAFAEFGFAPGLASVGHCRRPFYLDGSAVMYGSTARPDFTGMEGPEDDRIGVVGVWTPAGELTGLLVNVACPSQVLEATYQVSADMFGEMRRMVRLESGRDIPILCQVGAAGDISPRDLTIPYRGGPTYWDEAGMVELGGRLAAAVLAALPQAERARRPDHTFRHEVLFPRLPLRVVSPRDYARAVAEFAALAAREPADETSPESAYSRFVRKKDEREKLPVPGPYDDKNDDFVLMRNSEAVIRRFERQRVDPCAPIEVHALRLGDLALSTSPFELFVDYAMRIRARSPARQSFHAQLTGDGLGYLPTARATEAGGYGALIINGLVGPEGGQLLVETILEAYGRLFPD